MEGMSKTQTFDINWFAAAGSALGAVSSAVLLSTLGAAGTLVGAAVGSLTITVGGSIYTQSLQKTKARVDTLRGAERPERQDSASPVDSEPTSGSASSSTPKPPKKPLGETLRGLPWKRITVLAVGLFVAAMAVILAFELSTGRPVSSFTGGSSDTRTGTTFSGLKPSSDKSPDAVDSEKPSDEQSSSPSQSAEAEPTEEKPAEEKPAEEKPAEEKPAEEKPAEEKPAGETVDDGSRDEAAAPLEPPALEEAPAAVVPPAAVEPRAAPQPGTDG